MSRLLTNSSQYRNSLNARKLYTIENPYDASESDTVNAISTIINTLKPFSSFDLSNSLLGRQLGSNNTPLAKIGLQMLANQLGYSAASNAAAEFLPDINFKNLFDGDPNSKLIVKKIDRQITRRDIQSTVGRILEEISGRYPTNGNPFPETRVGSYTYDSNTIVINTGKGQLQSLFEGLNKNANKPSSSSFLTTIENEGFDYGNSSGVIDNRKFFLKSNSEFTPFDQYTRPSNFDGFIERLNNDLSDEINEFKSSTANKSLEYGSSQQFVDALGKTKKFIKEANNAGNEFFLVARNNGLNDDPNEQLVWGRDYVKNDYVQSSNTFDDPTEGVEPSPDGGTINKVDRNTTSPQNVFELGNGGLLSYTRDLLNSKGKYGNFDLKRKKFIDENEVLHFNGSPLTRRLIGNEIDRSRQHSVLDPYNTFVKAIRYNGNKIYNGNPNSVIYDTVIPKITPTFNDVGIDRKLMFSIENLAYQVSKPNGSGIVYAQDDSRVVLPECEAGANGGRVMWFPPYDIRLSENVIVNRETTTFLGRGEPIYTYANTERIANLSFKLIIDYPPQLRNSNVRDHEEAARFFAFGGSDEVTTVRDGSALEKQKNELIKEREEIKPKPKSAPDIPSKKISFYFANDEPSVGGEYYNIDEHIEGNYEIAGETVTFGDDGRNTGLNTNFAADIDAAINEYFIDPEKAKFTKLVFVGSASDLFLGVGGDAYNQALSSRRITSLEDYVAVRYFEIIGRTIENDGIKIERNPIGGQGAELTDDAEEIPTDDAKQARRADVEFTKNTDVEFTEPTLTPEQIEDRELLDLEIQGIDAEIQLIRNQNRRANRNAGCDFTAYTIEDGVLKGYDPVINKKYKPAFHSQTPEDFHRRLTFLQQCCRQGEAVRKKRDDGNSFSSSNSVFGKQPVQVLRIGDFFHTKVVIDNMNIDYSDAPWDMNPEGMGMQFMIADVKLTLKLIGGQSLKTPIDILQNAVSYNYYANSTFYGEGVYANATKAESDQIKANRGSIEDSQATDPDSNPQTNDTKAIDTNNP